MEKVDCVNEMAESVFVVHLRKKAAVLLHEKERYCSRNEVEFHSILLVFRWMSVQMDRNVVVLVEFYVDY